MNSVIKANRDALEYISMKTFFAHFRAHHGKYPDKRPSDDCA